MRIVVDLPAPFGPRNPVTVPASTVKSAWSTATRSPYRLVSPTARIMRCSSRSGGARPPRARGALGRGAQPAAEPLEASLLDDGGLGGGQGQGGGQGDGPEGGPGR